MGKKKSKKSSKRAPEDDGDDGDDLAEQPPTVTESAAGAGSGSGAGGGAAAVDGAEAVAGSSATAAAEPEPRSEAPLAATEKREAAAATEAAAAHSQHNAPPVAAAQAAVSPSGVPAPEEVEMVMSTSAEAIDDMAAGLLGTFQPAVEAMLKQLREIKCNQDVLLRELTGETSALLESPELAEITETMRLLPIYLRKLNGIRQDMVNVHERSAKLKKRIDKVKVQKIKTDAAAELAREKAEARERVLLAKPAAELDVAAAAAGGGATAAISGSPAAAAAASNHPGTDAGGSGGSASRSATASPEPEGDTPAAEAAADATVKPIKTSKKSKKRSANLVDLG